MFINSEDFLTPADLVRNRQRNSMHRKIDEGYDYSALFVTINKILNDAADRGEIYTTIPLDIQPSDVPRLDPLVVKIALEEKLFEVAAVEWVEDERMVLMVGWNDVTNW